MIKSQRDIFIGVTVILSLFRSYCPLSEIENLITPWWSPWWQLHSFHADPRRSSPHLVVFFLGFMNLIRKDAGWLNSGTMMLILFILPWRECLMLNLWKYFPYLPSPSYLRPWPFAIIFFPVLVNFSTAITNYDFKHLPPNKLLDWVGFQTLPTFGNWVFRAAFALSWLDHHSPRQPLLCKS